MSGGRARRIALQRWWRCLACHRIPAFRLRRSRSLAWAPTQPRAPRPILPVGVRASARPAARWPSLRSR
eukprot:7954718-Alexandrium_andersonii.AAC.1